MKTAPSKDDHSRQEADLEEGSASQQQAHDDEAHSEPEYVEDKKPPAASSDVGPMAAKLSGAEGTGSLRASMGIPLDGSSKKGKEMENESKKAMLPPPFGVEEPAAAKLSGVEGKDTLRASMGVPLDGSSKKGKEMENESKKAMSPPPSGLEESSSELIDPSALPMPESQPGAIRVTAEDSLIDLSPHSGHSAVTFDIESTTITDSSPATEPHGNTIATAVTREELEAQVRTEILESAVAATHVEALELEASPNPETTRASKSKSRRSKQRRLFLWISVAFVLVLVGVVVGVVVAVTSNDTSSSSESDSSPTRPPSSGSMAGSSPTQSPGADRQRESAELREAIVDLLLEYFPGGNALRDGMSPGSRAVDWLTNSQPLTPNAVRANPQLIVQAFGLASVFSSTGGEFWTTGSDTWMRALNICEWHGVTCNNQSLVSEINLTRNNLDGYLPVEIGVLSGLTSLQLDNNILGNAPNTPRRRNQGTGLLPTSLPLSLGWLTDLRVLSVANSRMSGTLPTSLGLLTALEFFDARQNRLNGVIPSELGRMTSMVTFRVPGSQLDGPLPEELKNWTLIETFNVASNELDGFIPASFAESWSNLRVLRLLLNDFEGSLDGSFCNGTSIAIPSLTVVEADCDELACPCCTLCT